MHTSVIVKNAVQWAECETQCDETLLLENLGTRFLTSKCAVVTGLITEELFSL